MFGLAWLFLVSLCTLIFCVSGQIPMLINRLKGRSDLQVFEAICSGKDEVVSKNLMGLESDVVLQSEVIASTTSKYQFICGKDVRGFLEKPQTNSFTVEELFVCSDEPLNLDIQLSINNFEEKVTKFGEDQEKAEETVSVAEVSVQEKPEESVSVEEVFYQQKTEESTSVAEVNDQEKTEEYVYVEEVFYQQKTEESASVAEVNDQEKTEESASVAVVNDEENTEEIISAAEVNNQEKAEEIISVAEINEQEKAEETISVPEVNDNDKEKAEESIFAAEVYDQEKTEETISAVEVTDQANEDCAKIQFLPEDNPTNEEECENAFKYFLFLRNSEKREELEENSTPNMSCLDQESIDEGFIELQSSKDSRVTQHNAQSDEMRFWDSDSDEEIDILLEHQNLVQQIKMEMRNSRIRCLPTISEECESPKMVEDLKPLQIDEKLEYKDRMEEIQTFYKCYAEKMRKLDILNYQTLNAISLLQLKDSETFRIGKKALFSSNKLASLRGNKLRRIYVDQTQKSISELSHNLELVYVGHACLSWEILCWQYGKTKELLEYDAKGHHTYNHVAGEFLQFQVLMQRFVEDQPYQGHRLQCYAKNRCVLRTFLQVPVLKDDCCKEKKARYEEETDIISLAKLTEIINNTMHIFWEFLHADKDEATLALKGHSPQVDPADSELLIDIATTLQKKERKLKEIQRSGNCIVKKLQKQQERRVNEAIFICRVELRLVAKAVRLPRLRREHLVWCKKKLNNINIVGRKVSVEPSCLLFPC